MSLSISIFYVYFISVSISISCLCLLSVKSLQSLLAAMEVLKWVCFSKVFVQRKFGMGIGHEIWCSLFYVYMTEQDMT